MRDPRVQHICDQIKLLDGQDPEELARLKRQLPIITPHACRFTGDGSRKSANAVPSGLVMLDIDHVAEPRRIYAEHIAPLLSPVGRGDVPVGGEGGSANPSGSPRSSWLSGESGGSGRPNNDEVVGQCDPLAERVADIHFVAITPSGHGLRIIADRQEGESLIAAQTRLANLCGFAEYDAVTHDLARASYLMPWSYVLYCEPKGLNFRDAEHAEAVASLFERSDVPAGGEGGPAAVYGLESTPAEGAQPAQSAQCLGEADTTLYRGIAYAEIVRELANLLGGTPEMGERNQFYFTMVKYMRYICDFNAATCVAVLPDYGLSLSERTSTAQSAVNRPRKNDIPDLLQRAITTAKLTNSPEGVQYPIGGTPSNSEASYNHLPALPRVLELICRRLPEGFRPAMVIAALPILGALATRVRFQYLDKQEHSFSFMSCITAPAATGKSFIRKPVNLLLTPIDRQDEIERQKEEEYKEALKAAKNSKMQPTNPRPCPRNNGINVSIAKLLQLLSYSDGKHLIGIGEEIDTLVKSERAGVWSQKSDIYRLGFDNAKYGQNYMSDNSFSANVPVYYNLLLTGTPGGMYRFFKDVEDGLVTRFCFAQLPDMFGADIPAFENYTAKEEEEIIAIAEKLDKASGTIACSHVGTRIRRWLNDKRELAIREDSRAIDTLRKRSAVIGYRAGMLAYLLNGCKYDKAVGDFTAWVAEYIFQNQMQLFGHKFEEVAQQQLIVNERRSQVTSLLTQLPETFTRNELMALRARNGQSTHVATVISRWRSAGFIVQVEKNTYHKTPKAYARV